ncbi:MAG: succinate dehydrogenase assembly factor 2 [Candidatus Portiera sp.]|nr:succinate dehydrogenase assembly factor 2 [Portiera sp.]
MEQQSINHLLWQSRRGALELDIILSNYIVSYYSKVSSELRLQFQELLKEEDPQILDWLVYKSSPPAQHADIIADILKNNTSNKS